MDTTCAFDFGFFTPSQSLSLARSIVVLSFSSYFFLSFYSICHISTTTNESTHNHRYFKAFFIEEKKLTKYSYNSFFSRKEKNYPKTKELLIKFSFLFLCFSFSQLSCMRSISVFCEK